MSFRRFTAAATAAFLGSFSLLSACNGSSSGLVPNSLHGTIESMRMTPHLHATLIAQMQQKIKHVFVIYQENHSFDNYFGTFPGAENLGTQLAKTHGFRQYDYVAKRQQTVFKITNPDILGPDQDRYVLEQKFAGGKMNNFLTGEELDNIVNFGVKPGVVDSTD